MISSKLLPITLTLIIVSCYLVTKTEQYSQKWIKPYVRDGPIKYTHLPYKPQSLHHGPPQQYLQPIRQKTSKVPLDNCQLRKVVFTQDAESPQYIVYKSKIPDLKEFTLCHWHNIFNYTHDQPIFSYSHSGKSRVIYSWIENSPDKTYYSLAINGHTIYRINYPEKLFKWYHVCQSWNGHTGEWQLWINTERVARGFYNLMVGKLIKGGGVAISGREYLDQALALHFPAYSGELTLVSLYKAALTAGKAYNDHKHHHVHNFHHGYDESVDEADTAEPPSTTAGPDPTPPPHLAHGGQFNFGQLVPKLPVPESNGGDGGGDGGVVTGSAMRVTGDDYVQFDGRTPFDERPQPEAYDEQRLFDGGLYDYYASTTPAADETFRVNLLETVANDVRYKRNATGGEAGSNAGTVRPKRWTADAAGRKVAARSPAGSRDPAEWEVTKVAAVCSACETDPFGTASVLSWHDTRKQFYNGALYLPAQPSCYLF